MGLIYLIKNKINNKCYIGQTIRSLKKRWKEHCSETGCSAINGAIKKYLPENFEVSVLIETNDDEELDDLETKYIQQYNSLYPNGYNIQTGGKTNKKHCHMFLDKTIQLLLSLLSS